jgi:hypothetical protein
MNQACFHPVRRLLALTLALCACTPDPSDVRPTIHTLFLQVTPDALGGTLVVRYENMGDERLTIEDPELQMKAADRTIRSVELTFPEELDLVFEPGESAEVHFTIHDEGAWTDWCGQAIEAQVDHHSVRDDGTTITSLGADRTIELTCF